MRPSLLRTAAPSTPRRLTLALLVLAALPFGCGDDAGTGGGGTMTTTSTTGSSTTSTTGSKMTTSSSTSSSSTSTGTGGEGGSSPSDVEATITDVALFADCMPIVGPDPMNGSFDATFTNSGGTATTMTVTGARLELTEMAETLVWSFDVTPASTGSVPAMGMISATFTKVTDSGSGTGTTGPCGVCGAAGQLFVDFADDQGGTASATAPVEMFGCAF
ncbi:MAG: hypothetical protein JNL21_13255 [Myxococcales bacterium]|nr:hypothetical protein [Myxococcales bacterium]